MTPEERANIIVSETQLIDNTHQEAHQVKVELVTLITQAIREAIAEEREACARDAEAFALVHSLRGYQADEVAEAIARIIRARANTETA